MSCGDVAGVMRSTMVLGYLTSSSSHWQSDSSISGASRAALMTLLGDVAVVREVIAAHDRERPHASLEPRRERGEHEAKHRRLGARGVNVFRRQIRVTDTSRAISMSL